MNLDLIKNKLITFYNKYQRMPTHGEMVKIFHYASRGSTHYLVKRLMKEGIVEKDENGKLIPKSLLNIPMLGTIKAGYPMPAEVLQEESLNLHILFKDVTHGSYALKVSGDSMVDAGIYEDDYVIVNNKKEPHNGDVVAACIDGEWTVKYFKKADGNVTLVPANENYPELHPIHTLEIGEW